MTISGSNSTSLSKTTHPALVTVQPGAPLEVHQVPTPTPDVDVVKVLVEYTATSPLDQHQASGHLLVQPPQILGSSVGGTVIEVGSAVRRLKVGDRVFGYTFRGNVEKSYQLIVVTKENQLAEIPEGYTAEGVVGVTTNFVSAWHAITARDGAGLGLELPWPKPQLPAPDFYDRNGTAAIVWTPERFQRADDGDWILIWGGGSSVAQYALQILKWYGYQNVVVVASPRHFSKLKRYGAGMCLSYTDPGVVDKINYLQGRCAANGTIRYFLDCVGSVEGSIKPLSKVARSGSIVAVFLPVIVKDASEGIAPEYNLDATAAAAWADGVETVGLRTHFYTQNTVLAERLQPVIMPIALEAGIIIPSERITVEGKTMLERATKALRMLQDKQANGAKLVWKVAEQEQIDHYVQSKKA